MSVEAAINEVLAYARDDTHGYELRCRDLDYGLDCAGLMVLYASLVEGVPFNRYPSMHTWNMADVMCSRGWRSVPFSENEKRRGDVLVRSDPKSGTGHAVLCLGGNEIVGAEGDWDGRRGDSSGGEIVRRSYYPYSYQAILRWEPPMAEVREVKNGVYRLYDPSTGMHHYTASHDEAQSLVALGWVHESTAISTRRGTVTQYRLYNPHNGAHLVTSSSDEAIELACMGWVVEGHAFKTPTSGTKVYRVYNPNNGDHVYTSDTKEIETCVAAGWVEEGLAFYSA